MKKHLITIFLVILGFYVSAQTPTLTLSIADANMLPSIKPSGAHFKVDRVYGQNLQTEYYFKYGIPTSPLSPFLASLHFNITSTYIDPATGLLVEGYWTTEKVYSALINTIDFSKSMDHLVSAADIFKSDSTRIALDSVRLEDYKGTVVTALNSKFNNPTGTTTQYLNGQGSSVSFQWLTDSTLMVVTQRFVSKDSIYNNPTWIGYLDYSTKLSNKPNLSVYETTSHAASTFYPLTNPNGFISSVPVSSIFGRTGSVVGANGDYNTSQVSENTNLYYTAARFNTAFSGKSTTDLIEGTNLYYTSARFNTAFGTKSTTDLTEGTNLYFTTARARSSISAGNELSYNSTTGVVSKTKRTETYSGVTNASGNYTITFGTSYSVAPNIQANLTAGTNTSVAKITAISTTGFTINVTNRNEVLGLLPTYSNVVGVNVDVVVTEK